MKKSKKIVLRMIPVLMLVVVVLASPVFGFSSFEGSASYDGVGDGGSAGVLEDTVNNAWAVISMVLKLAAVAAIIFAGVRYMFASADTKADIKKQLVILVVGAVLVFGASFIVDLITNATKDITGV